MPLDNHWQTQFNSVNNIAGKVLTTQEIPSSVNPVRSLSITAYKCINKQDRSPKINSAYMSKLYRLYCIYKIRTISLRIYICIAEIFPLMILFVTNDRNANDDNDMYNISNFYSII